MKYETDFGLVAMEESRRERLIGEIAKLAMVKDVNLDLSYTRDLLGSNGGGAFVDGKKRPGKIFTSMSFSEGEHYAMASTSNSTINWGRRLLMQV